MPARSGWGFELTMLLPAYDDAPPASAVRLLERLGTCVDTSARPFGPGHRTDLGEVITGELLATLDQELLTDSSRGG